MRKVLMRWRCVVACAVVLSVVGIAEARDTAPARTADADARPRIAGAEREPREPGLRRLIRRLVKSLGDELIGPRP